MDSDKHPPEDLDSTQTFNHESGPPQRIGNYRILQQLGEGGMGVVYLAEQEHPIRRRVALKIIKLGMDTEAVIARFEAERQALALMNHANVAKVFDAGTTEQGRPFFVMEYVKGVPITAHCDRQRLTTKERLEIFNQVCDGVQHAHQKGIIHRDIKPSNALVQVEGNKHVPKIIDFGVAKATEQRLTERTLFTELGQLIGTPEYMSPEQAEMTVEDVDTRTDVYSLGVLLYELLVGTLPFDSKELRQAGFDEIRRRIREDEPSRPSTRMSTLGEESKDSAVSRRTDPRSLIRELRGDLDWITMKAMEKDRTRRYGSPSDLATDIERYLSHEPVIASPPGAAYRMGKFVRRHKVGVAAGAVVAVALVLGMLGATVGLVRARTAEAQAKREAETAEQMSDFVVGLFEVSDPSEARGNAITAREVLERGAEKIELELSEQPLVRARLQHTIGKIYLSLGLPHPAAALLKTALPTRGELLGEDHAETLSTMWWLAGSHVNLREYAEAESYFAQILDSRRRTLGAADPATLEAMVDVANIYQLQKLYDEAEKLLLDVIEIQERTPGGADVERPAAAISILGSTYYNQGRFKKAEPLLAKALEVRSRELGDDHPRTLYGMFTLGITYSRLGRHDEAELLLREALEAQRRVHGDDSHITLGTMHFLAKLYEKMGRLDDARPLAAETRLGWRRLAAEEPEADASTTNAYAWALLTCEPTDFRDPQIALRFALKANETTEFEHPMYLDTLALAYHLTGDSEKAIEIQQKAISLLPEGESSDRTELEGRLAQFQASLTSRE